VALPLAGHREGFGNQCDVSFSPVLTAGIAILKRCYWLCMPLSDARGALGRFAFLA